MEDSIDRIVIDNEFLNTFFQELSLEKQIKKYVTFKKTLNQERITKNLQPFTDFDLYQVLREHAEIRNKYS